MNASNGAASSTPLPRTPLPNFRQLRRQRDHYGERGGRTAPVEARTGGRDARHRAHQGLRPDADRCAAVGPTRWLSKDSGNGAGRVRCPARRRDGRGMTKRRGNGEDSIYKDGDRWRGAVSVGYDDKGRRVRKKVS